MSKEYVEKVESSPSIYTITRGETRNLNVYYSVPDRGVDKETGVLLLIPGYGGHANSNVYKKMRRLFPDQYNLIVVQCDYFGWEFMQDVNEGQLISLINQAQISFAPSPEECSLVLPVNLSETLQNYNDMGPVQVMDLMNALKLVSEEYDGFNRSKVIAYGHSHGAYLALFCNILMPRLFSTVIDISGMLFPVYLDSSKMFRQLTHELICTDQATGKRTRLMVGARFDYLNSKICQDVALYDLVRWYGLRNNLAKIITFQGAGDTMVPSESKKDFLSRIDRATCVMVNESMVDRRMFYSTEHGCGADYLELFRHVWETYDLTSEHECCVLEDQLLETDSFRYDICRLADRMRMFVTSRSC